MGAASLRGLLPNQGGVGAQPALTLEGQGFLIRDADQYHFPIQVIDPVIRQIGPDPFLHTSIRIKNLQHLFFQRIIVLDHPSILLRSAAPPGFGKRSPTGKNNLVQVVCPISPFKGIRFSQYFSGGKTLF
jgi:hypothetical protein